MAAFTSPSSPSHVFLGYVFKRSNFRKKRRSISHVVAIKVSWSHFYLSVLEIQIKILINNDVSLGSTSKARHLCICTRREVMLTCDGFIYSCCEKQDVKMRSMIVSKRNMIVSKSVSELLKFTCRKRVSI